MTIALKPVIRRAVCFRFRLPASEQAGVIDGIALLLPFESSINLGGSERLSGSVPVDGWWC